MRRPDTDDLKMMAMTVRRGNPPDGEGRRTGVVVAPAAVDAAGAGDDTQSVETAAVGVFVFPKMAGA